MKKIIFIILLFLVLISCFYNYTYGFGFDEDTSIVEQAKEWITLGKSESSTIKMGKTGYWSKLAGVLTGAGIWVILISGAILGIRFMLADPDHKAEVKKSLTIWLIGSIVILAALMIWRTLITILDIY